MAAPSVNGGDWQVLLSNLSMADVDKFAIQHVNSWGWQIWLSKLSTVDTDKYDCLTYHNFDVENDR